MSGLSGQFVCDHCAELMAELASDALVPESAPPGVRTTSSSAPLTVRDAIEARRRFAKIHCSFCGRSRAEFGPGGGWRNAGHLHLPWLPSARDA